MPVRNLYLFGTGIGTTAITRTYAGYGLTTNSQPARGRSHRHTRQYRSSAATDDGKRSERSATD